jgi:hypothetical protein
MKGSRIVCGALNTIKTDIRSGRYSFDDFLKRLGVQIIETGVPYDNEKNKYIVINGPL